ncbi:MAG: DegT/DnrJ/EryC1/StrS family aminotransferase [Bdellovibrionota bacterium]
MNESISVPLLDLVPQFQSLQAELEEAVARVVRSQVFILGPEVEAFEKECAEYCRSRFALGVSSGTDALLLALMSLDIGRDDEVITTPYTFFATAGSISRVGAKPVFVDIEPDTFNMDVSQVGARITQRTKALMPVHLYGQCVKMPALQKLAHTANIPIIEDAAQAIGAEDSGTRAGNFGAVGCFSFFPSKNLGAFGDAGLVTTNDETLYGRLKKLRVHGGFERYYHDEIGGNFRIDALQAAVLRIKLRALDSWSAGREKNAEIYRRLFIEAGLAEQGNVLPNDSAPVALPAPSANGRHVYNQFVIRAVNRDALQKYLGEHRVQTAIYYPVPLHLQACFRDLGYKTGDFPQAELAAQQTLALPIFPELSMKQLETVVGRISEFFHKQ